MRESHAASSFFEEELENMNDIVRAAVESSPLPRYEAWKAVIESGVFDEKGFPEEFVEYSVLALKSSVGCNTIGGLLLERKALDGLMNTWTKKMMMEDAFLAGSLVDFGKITEDDIDEKILEKMVFSQHHGPVRLSHLLALNDVFPEKYIDVDILSKHEHRDAAAELASRGRLARRLTKRLSFDDDGRVTALFCKFLLKNVPHLDFVDDNILFHDAPDVLKYGNSLKVCFLAAKGGFFSSPERAGFLERYADFTCVFRDNELLASGNLFVRHEMMPMNLLQATALSGRLPEKYMTETELALPRENGFTLAHYLAVSDAVYERPFPKKALNARCGKSGKIGVANILVESHFITGCWDTERASHIVDDMMSKLTAETLVSYVDFFGDRLSLVAAVVGHVKLGNAVKKLHEGMRSERVMGIYYNGEPLETLFAARNLMSMDEMLARPTLDAFVAACRAGHVRNMMSMFLSFDGKERIRLFESLNRAVAGKTALYLEKSYKRMDFIPTYEGKRKTNKKDDIDAAPHSAAWSEFFMAGILAGMMEHLRLRQSASGEDSGTDAQNDCVSGILSSEKAKSILASYAARVAKRFPPCDFVRECAELVSSEYACNACTPAEHMLEHVADALATDNEEFVERHMREIENSTSCARMVGETFAEFALRLLEQNTEHENMCDDEARSDDDYCGEMPVL